MYIDIFSTRVGIHIKVEIEVDIASATGQISSAAVQFHCWVDDGAL
jgi:hypothetical protein